MNYERGWTNRHNAAGFAAECARLALPFYGGDRKPALVAAIEVAERYADGGKGGNAGVAAAAYASVVDIGTDTAVGFDAAADAATYAAYTTYAAYVDAYAAHAAQASTDAGVDAHEIQTTYARWFVRDLSGGRELPTELRQAAGAAIVAGDEDLARALVQGEV